MKVAVNVSMVSWPGFSKAIKKSKFVTEYDMLSANLESVLMEISLKDSDEAELYSLMQQNINDGYFEIEYL